MNHFRIFTGLLNAMDWGVLVSTDDKKSVATKGIARPDRQMIVEVDEKADD